MNKIVRHNYPVSKLPEDLREGLPEDQTVTVEVAVETRQQTPHRTLEDIFAHAPRTFASVKEVNDYVRAMRDEWDDDR